MLKSSDKKENTCETKRVFCPVCHSLANEIETEEGPEYCCICGASEEPVFLETAEPGNNFFNDSMFEDEQILLESAGSAMMMLDRIKDWRKAVENG